MAEVTSDSSSAEDERERAWMRASYVRGLVVEASERSDSMRSFWACSVLNLGRSGVAVEVG